MPQLQIQDALKLAIQQQREGKLQAAAAIYQSVLKVQSNNPDAHNLLGVILASNGDNEKAVVHFRSAVSVNPQPDFYYNLGLGLRRMGQFEDAVSACESAIKLKPEFDAPYITLGKSLRSIGRCDEAEAAFRRAIEIAPGKPGGWIGLVSLLDSKENADEIESLLIEAIGQCKDSADLHVKYGLTLRDQKDRNLEAIERFYLALHLDSKNAQAMVGLSHAFVKKSQLENEVLSKVHLEQPKNLLLQALESAPQDAKVLNALGKFEQQFGKQNDAIRYFELANRSDNQFWEAYCNLANSYKRKGRLSESIKASESGLAILKKMKAMNKWAAGTVEYASALLSSGRFAESESVLREAIQSTTDKSLGSLISQLLLMSMHYSHHRAEEIQQEHITWDARYSQPLFDSFEFPERQSNEKIRLGFVSGDLSAHPVGYFCVGMFENLSKSDFESHVYSTRSV